MKSPHDRSKEHPVSEQGQAGWQGEGGQPGRDGDSTLPPTLTLLQQQAAPSSHDDHLEHAE